MVYLQLICFEMIANRKANLNHFSGVGAQHQNAAAERAVQTIMYMVISFMIHSLLHWPEHGLENLVLWSFDV